MRKRFDWLTLIFSLLFVFVGTGLYSGMSSMGFGTSGVCVRWISGLFLVMLLSGVAGLEVSLLLKRRKYQVGKRPNRIVNIIIAAILSAVIGGLGQFIFMFEIQTTKEVKEISNDLEGLNVVMLMDYSGSMVDKKASCINAAIQLVNQMDEKISLQYIGFAGMTEKSKFDENVSELLPMTSENKEKMKDFIQNINLTGGTYFDMPLETAVDTLVSQSCPGYKSVIIMLTDGESFISQYVKDKLLGMELDFYTIRIGIPDLGQEIFDFVDRDFSLGENPDGTINTEEVLEVFQEALSSSVTITEEKTKLGIGTDFILEEGTELYIWRIFARLITFAVYAALIAKAHYNQLDKKQWILNLITGLFVGIISLFNLTVSILLLMVVCLGAYTSLEIEEM